MFFRSPRGHKLVLLYVCVIVSGEQFPTEPLTNRKSEDRLQIRTSPERPTFLCRSRLSFLRSCRSVRKKETCWKAKALKSRTSRTSRISPSNCFASADIFQRRDDFRPFSSVANGINAHGKLIMHRPDWVFAFINDNFKLDEAQIGQIKQRLMGSYCHFSV